MTAKQNTSTMTGHQKSNDRIFTLKEIIKLIPSFFLLPMVLGISTVVITIHQQNITLQQRAEDRQLARERRELEKTIADEKCEQEYNISAEQRDISEKQRKRGLDIQIQQYRNTLLVEYIREIGQMLERNQGSLTNNTIIATLARVQTLSIVRQFDSHGKAQIIQFLYEAGQLTASQNPLDLSTADLNNMNMNSSISELPMNELSLAGVQLRFCSFVAQVY
ncbi:unnamed protein product [Rotaria socialis]|uniref:Uncharacterized protein n=2 Tax=Rotaria socialis TaxID=392032 RepID=A0A818DEK9_9BILA|nr:unnamed protein product [Rotaria socialis]CAF4569565.1 unnamed protein product [Rotaria socialis]